MSGLDRTLYPFESHYFDRGDNIRMHYVDVGPAAPVGTVVMLHGNPSWSFYYRDLIREMAKTHRCIVPDHVGMGLSDKPDDDRYTYTLGARVGDVTALLDAVCPSGPLTMVVHDWGGMIGFAWAVDHAERIERLVVLNTAAFPLPSTRKLPWQLKLARTPLGPLLVRGANAFAIGAALTGVTRTKLSPAVRDGLLYPYSSFAARRAVLRFVQDIPLVAGNRGFDIVQRTAELLSRFADTPTLIGWGLRDFVFDHHFLSEWRRRLPAARVIEYPDAGHYVLEDVAEELINEIASFIRAART